MFEKIKAGRAKKAAERATTWHTEQASKEHLRSQEIFEANKVMMANLAINHTTERDIVAGEILNQNALGGREIPELMGRWSEGDKEKKAERLLAIYGRSPETAGLLVRDSIDGFHASNSSTLLGVLEHGLLSTSELRAQDRMVTAGEHVFTGANQNFVSFVDWRDPNTIAAYSGISGGGYERLSLERLDHEIAVASRQKDRHQESGFDALAATCDVMIGDLAHKKEFLMTHLLDDVEKAELMLDNFPVAYGVSVDRDANGKVTTDGFVPTVHSDIRGEFAIMGEVAPTNIKMIAVPLAQLEYVKSLTMKFNRDDISIVPIELFVE